jgi:hypothetical protein
MQPNARFLLAVCRHRRGDPAGGQAELDLAVKLTPDDASRKRLAEWYRGLTR